MPVARRKTTQQTAPDMGDEPWESRSVGIEGRPVMGVFREGTAKGGFALTVEKKGDAIPLGSPIRIGQGNPLGWWRSPDWACWPVAKKPQASAAVIVHALATCHGHDKPAGSD